MTSNVTPFPIGTRVTSENDGIWWGLYYRLESLARRIHFLIDVAKQQDSPEPWKTYKYIRKRTVKRCFLAIAKKWETAEKRIHSLRKDGWYETAINIFLELLTVKKWITEDILTSQKERLIPSDPKTPDFEIVAELLRWFHLSISDIVQVVSWHIDQKIRWYNDDTYSFLRRLQNITIQE